MLDKNVGQFLFSSHYREQGEKYSVKLSVKWAENIPTIYFH